MCCFEAYTEPLLTVTSFFSAFTELYLRITMNRNVYCYGETLVSLYSRSI